MIRRLPRRGVQTTAIICASIFPMATYRSSTHRFNRRWGNWTQPDRPRVFEVDAVLREVRRALPLVPFEALKKA